MYVYVYSLLGQTEGQKRAFLEGGEYSNILSLGRQGKHV